MPSPAPLDALHHASVCGFGILGSESSPTLLEQEKLPSPSNESSGGSWLKSLFTLLMLVSVHVAVDLWVLAETR